MSYVRFADEYESGRLTELCKRLSGEMWMQSGEEFHIFQDRKDIAWGEQWKQRIEESVDAVTFLIPIIMPAFFTSTACREELQRFLDREKQLERGDLILPVYYVTCPVLSDPAHLKADSMVKTVADREYVDWRELRFKPLTTPKVGKLVEGMARQIVEALKRGHPASPRMVPVNYEECDDRDGTKTVSCWDPAAPGVRYAVTVPKAATRAEIVTAFNAQFAARKAAGLDYPTFTPPPGPAVQTATVTV